MCESRHTPSYMILLPESEWNDPSKYTRDFGMLVLNKLCNPETSTLCEYLCWAHNRLTPTNGRQLCVNSGKSFTCALQ